MSDETTASLLADLCCSRCGTIHHADQPQNLCRSCHAPLLARYHLERLDGQRWREALATRERSLWRYAELLPLRYQRFRVSLGERLTPLLEVPHTARRLGLNRLRVKDEGLLPTGSFKARGAAMGVSRARELGLRRVALPTAGNAGAAWAIYAARAGIEAHVIMPADAPAINVREVLVSGATLQLVRGLISDAGALVARLVAESETAAAADPTALPPFFNAATLAEPYRIEGKKTMGFELVEQLGWQVPDVILYPCGGGVGLIGMWKAFDELQAVGLLDARRPRLIAVQSEGCAPIVRAWRAGESRSTFWQEAHTVASGLRVPKPLGDELVLRALHETGGTAIAVSDEAIVEAVAAVARHDGLFLSPEGAATIAALPELRAQGAIQFDETVVVFNTGSGLKYPEVVRAEAEYIDPLPRG